MAHPPKPVSADESAGCNVSLEDASTQTTSRNLFVLVDTRDASTQTSEEFVSPEKSSDASKQTPEDDVSLLEQPPATPETSEESRKRRISKVQEMTPGSDVDKLLRTETCKMVHEFDSSLNVLPVDSGNTRNVNIQENVASSKTISHKENAPREKSDTDVSKVTNVGSVDDAIAVSGPSGCIEKQSPSKSYEGELKESPIKQQSSEETEQKHSTCLACKQTVFKHVKDELYLYKCCRCPREFTNFNHLQIHVYDEHSKPHSCPTCKVNYSDVNSHISGGTCELCEGETNFECRYELEEHYISEHKEFIDTKCRICRKKLDEHLTTGVVVRYNNKYQCCVSDCKKTGRCTNTLNRHLGTHSPLKLYKCELCDCHIKNLEQHKQKSHPFCTFCKERFVNIFFLNEHLCEKRKEEELLM